MFGVTSSAFIGGCITLYFGGLIAAAGGVGGGGLIVPILLLVFGYDLDTSVNLSVCMVVGSSLAQFIININKRHPIVLSRPLIYWELVLTLLPSQLGGANIGQILSKMLPESFVYILALLVLSVASTLTLKKGLHKWHVENENFQAQSTATKHLQDIMNTVNLEGEDKGDEIYDINNPIVTAENGINNNMTVRDTCNDVNDANKPDTFEITRSSSIQPRAPSIVGTTIDVVDNLRDSFRESLAIYTDRDNTHELQLPTLYLVTISIMWVSCTCLSVGRTLVNRCSIPYLSLLGLIYLPIFCAHYIVIVLNRRSLSSNASGGKGQDKSQLLVTSPISDIDLSDWNTLITLMTVSYFVGIVCSMLGIGGGEIFSPIILSYGVMPEVTSATTGTMSFLNALTLMLRSITKGVIPLNLGLIIFSVGLLSGISGRQLGLWVSAKYGRASVIVFFLALGLYCSCLYYIYTLGFTAFDSTLHEFC